MTVERNRVVQDKTNPNMYRIHWHTGEISDWTNLTRAREAVRSYEEYKARLDLEGPPEPLGRPLVRLN